MTAKQYLRQLWRLQQNIRILTEEIEERRTQLTSTAVPTLGDKVQTSPGGDKFADMIAALADKEVYQEQLLYEYNIMRAEILGQIMALDNEMYVEVLRSRYLLRKQLKQIAKETNYSYDRICHIHGEALLAFSKKYLQPADDSIL